MEDPSDLWGESSALELAEGEITPGEDPNIARVLRCEALSNLIAHCLVTLNISQLSQVAEEALKGPLLQGIKTSF